MLQRCGLTPAHAKAGAIERDRPFGLIRRTLDSLVGASRPTFEVVDQLLGTTGTELRGLVDAPELRFRVIDQITDAVDHLAAEQPLWASSSGRSSWRRTWS